MEHAFTWVSIIPGLDLMPVHTAHATLVIVGLLAWAWAARRQMQAATDPAVPDATLTARNSLEIFVEWFVGFIEGLLGRKGRQYVHVYATFFLFILAANLIGLLPGFAPPTSDFNVTFALGVTSFIVYNYYGLKQKGVAYLKHFMGPIWWLAFLMLPLELIDNFVRPVSLALRLFGNMTGDHLVLEIFTGLTKVEPTGILLWGVAIAATLGLLRLTSAKSASEERGTVVKVAPVVLKLVLVVELLRLFVPVVFYMLGAFVSLIQAFVFTILSIIYLSLALAEHEEHEEAHH